METLRNIGRFIRPENPAQRASAAIVCAIVPPILIAGDVISIYGGANLQTVHYLTFALAAGMNIFGIANGNWSRQSNQ